MTESFPSTHGHPPKLDSREQHFRIPGPLDGRSLFLRFLPTENTPVGPRRSVLYVHGATFPSALSIAHRFDGRSWRDALCDAGFDVWGLDFYGFGNSDRYSEMDRPGADSAPLCATEDAARQLEAGIRFILGHQNIGKISLIAHSWGSMPVGRFAGDHAALIDRLVLFAPIARREPRRYESPALLPGWRIVTVEDQWNCFVEDVPAHEPPVLSRIHFDDWRQRYLDSDPASRSRDPAGVKTPLGPFSEIIKAWHGGLAYDPALVRAPVAIIRGEWDGLVGDDDARWLFDAFTQSPIKRDIKIGRGTHLMHLEAMRLALWQESIGFLRGEDSQPSQPEPSTISPLPEKERFMFSVIFEVCPNEGRQDDYLKLAKHLKPILEKIDGFVDNERFESKRRPGWLLSHSTWRDEKSVIRWRTEGEHHAVQEKGRFDIFQDYHLRVGEVTADTDPPAEAPIREQRLDETEIGAKLATFTEIVPEKNAAFAAQTDLLPAHLGLDLTNDTIIDYDIYASIYNPGKLALLVAWKSPGDAEVWVPKKIAGIHTLRHRKVRVVREYGRFDRRESPQFYPDIKGVETKHSRPAQKPGS